MIGVMKLAAELEASLREFASAGAAELCENGGRLAPLSKLSWEVRGSEDKPLPHIWLEQYNLTRRVIAIRGGRRLKDRGKARCPRQAPRRLRYRLGYSNCRSGDSR
jgi:hypothetical protein